MILQKGVYYIGDLCYVMDQEWEELCDLIEGNQYPDEGVYRFKDGRRFAIFNTAYGDGEYYDKEERSYPVDSGTIGCIKVDDLTKEFDDSNEGPFRLSFGSVVEMQNDFYCYSDGKTLHFGHIAIRTN